MPETLSPNDIQHPRAAVRRVAENTLATRGAQEVTMHELAQELGGSAITDNKLAGQAQASPKGAAAQPERKVGSTAARQLSALAR
jgi:hypothetical protein